MCKSFTFHLWDMLFHLLFTASTVQWDLQNHHLWTQWRRSTTNILVKREKKQQQQRFNYKFWKTKGLKPDHEIELKKMFSKQGTQEQRKETWGRDIHEQSKNDSTKKISVNCGLLSSFSPAPVPEAHRRRPLETNQGTAHHPKDSEQRNRKQGSSNHQHQHSFFFVNH